MHTASSGRLRIPHAGTLCGIAGIAVLVAAAVAVWFPLYRQASVIAQIQEIGGYVHTVSSAPDWIADWTGPFENPVFARVVSVTFPSDATDADLALVELLPEVSSVTLQGDRITDEGLRSLHDRPKLFELDLIGCTQVSAEALAELRRAHPAVLIYQRRMALLGVAGETTTPKCVIQSVLPGSAAETAGLRPGDVITEFDGWAISDFASLVSRVDAKWPGDPVEVVVERRGKTHRLRAVMGRYR